MGLGVAVAEGVLVFENVAAAAGADRLTDPTGTCGDSRADPVAATITKKAETTCVPKIMVHRRVERRGEPSRGGTGSAPGGSCIDVSPCAVGRSGFPALRCTSATMWRI